MLEDLAGSSGWKLGAAVQGARKSCLSILTATHTVGIP